MMCSGMMNARRKQIEGERMEEIKRMGLKEELEFREEWLKRLWMLENKEVPEEQQKKKEEMVFFMRKVAGVWSDAFGKPQKVYDEFSAVWHPELPFEEAFDLLKSTAWAEWMKEAEERQSRGKRIYKDYGATINVILTKMLLDGEPPWWNAKLRELGV